MTSSASSSKRIPEMDREPIESVWIRWGPSSAIFLLHRPCPVRTHPHVVLPSLHRQAPHGDPKVAMGSQPPCVPRRCPSSRMDRSWMRCLFYPPACPAEPRNMQLQRCVPLSILPSGCLGSGVPARPSGRVGCPTDPACFALRARRRPVQGSTSRRLHRRLSSVGSSRQSPAEVFP